MKKYTAHITSAILGAIIVLSACSDNRTDKSEMDAANERKQTTKVAENKPVQTESGGPALWMLQDEDTVVYLFGTVHLLKPETKWKTDKFIRAFEASDVVYQEANMDPALMAKHQAQFAAMMMYQGDKGLMDVLNDAEEKEVLEAAKLVGLPPIALTKQKPWFAYVNLSMMQIVKQGYRSDSGVDPMITKMAKADGKTLRFFETAIGQLKILSDMPEESQVNMLIASAKDIEDMPDMLDDMVEDWMEGDIDAIGELFADVDAMGDREVYEQILVNRNKKWAKEITRLMNGETGTFMITGGTAHFAGNDSVIKFLQDAGETVTRQ